MGVGISSSPFLLKLGRHHLQLAQDSRGKQDHFIRDAWRTFMVRTTKSNRRRSIAVKNIDVAPLRAFIGAHKGTARLAAWRCAVAAEPCPDRLRYIIPEVQPTCGSCAGARADSWHVMWECQETEALRRRHRLQLADIAGSRQGAELHAWALNGWGGD